MTKTEAMTALYGSPWAITPEAFDVLADAVENNILDMLMGLDDEDNPLYIVENGVAIIRICGHLSNSAGWYSDGLTYLEIVEAVAAANADESVQSLRFDIDSPGGQAGGVYEAAAAISASAKPTIASVAGQASSAAYWIASACGSIQASPSSIVGSIGTVMRMFSDDSEFVTFRSSPNKAADPTSSEGRDQYQQIVDDLTEVFVEQVAFYRGVSVETVIADYGNGAAMVSKRALAAGLIDEIVTSGASSAPLATMQSITNEGNSMEINDTPVIEAEAFAAVQSERDALAAQVAELESRLDGLEPKAVAEDLRAGMDAIRAEMSAFEARATQAESDLEAARAEVAQGAEDIAIAKLLAAGFVTPAEEVEAREAWKAKAAFPSFWARFEARTAPVIPQGEAGHGAPVAVKPVEAPTAASLDAQVIAYCKDNNLNPRSDYAQALRAVRSAQ